MRHYWETPEISQDLVKTPEPGEELLESLVPDLQCHRTRGNGHKLKHKFHLNMGKAPLHCGWQIAGTGKCEDIPKPPGHVPVSQLWVTLPPAGTFCPCGASLGFSGQGMFVAPCGCSWGWLLIPDSLWEPSASRARVRGKQGDSPDIPQPEAKVTLSINTPVSPSRTAEPGDSKCHTDSQGLLEIM